MSTSTGTQNSTGAQPGQGPDLARHHGSGLHRHSGLFPSIQPYDSFMLDVTDGHRLHVEQCGNPEGTPVIVLHGGPGSGSSPMQRRFFDPHQFRVVLFDQRGCGRSTPTARLEGNHTLALIDDIEAIRRRLGIERWIVFGGSWGASLGIAYAALHRERCLGLILRGTFLTGRHDLEWFFGGAGQLVPQTWQRLCRTLDLELDPSWTGIGLTVMNTLAKRLLGRESPTTTEITAAWVAWEHALSRPGLTPDAELQDDDRPLPHPSSVDHAVPKYRVQAHYLVQECFLGEHRLLEMASLIRDMPVEIVHGRLDWVCRPLNAWQVHKVIEGSRLQWVDRCGHDPYEPPMLKAISTAIRRVVDDCR